MADRDIIAERGRSLEDDYFRRRDKELVDKMRKAAEAEQARTEMGAKTGLTDPELLGQLQALGFTPDTIALLPLMPVLQVAWADREVTPGERDLIVKFARARGIGDGSAADRQLGEWLNRRPAEHVFTHATRLIRAMLGTAPGRTEVSPDDLVKEAEAIAAASGGIFGVLNRVSVEERQILNDLAQQLKS